MAYTRSQIKTLVQSRTGRTDKDTIIEFACDEALQKAMMIHDFDLNTELDADISVVEDDLYATLATDVYKVISALTIDSGDSAAILEIKDKTWFDRFALNPSDNLKAQPTHAYFSGGRLYFNCACDASYTVRVRTTSIPSFSSDSTECPISTLDIYVAAYATSEVFFDLEYESKYMLWRKRSDFELNGAIQADMRNPAKRVQLERGEAGRGLPRGLTVYDVDNDRYRYFR